jgi:integrase
MAHKGTNEVASRRVGRPAQGGLSAKQLSDGRLAWIARFSAYGKREKLTIGHNPPWDEQRAQEELAYILQQVKRGVWEPPDRAPAMPAPGITAPRLTIAQLSHEYIEHRTTRGKTPKGEGQQEELLQQHILPDWGKLHPEDATPENVRRFIDAKVKQSERLRKLWDEGLRTDAKGARLARPFGARRLNRSITALYRVLEHAHAFHDAPNMTDKLRKLELLLDEPKPVKSHFFITQVALLIEAAVELDAESRQRRAWSAEAFVAALLLTGVRLDEACQLRIGEVHRETHALNIAGSKTETGIREVNVVYGLQPILYRYLDTYREGASGSAFVFATRNGTALSPNNAREDIWYPAVERAQQLAAKRGITDSWPAKANPHVSRRTYITHLFEINEPVPYVQAQVGHADSALTIQVYNDVEKRRGPVPALTPQLYGTDRTRRVEPEVVLEDEAA